jgi:hypothetical protein
MAKGVSGKEAAEIAKSYVRDNFDPLPMLEATFERRGKAWVVIVKGGLPPTDREFEVRVNSETGKIVSCIEV